MIGGCIGYLISDQPGWALMPAGVVTAAITCGIGCGLGHFDKTALLSIIWFLMTMSMACVYGIISQGGFS